VSIARTVEESFRYIHRLLYAYIDIVIVINFNFDVDVHVDANLHWYSKGLWRKSVLRFWALGLLGPLCPGVL